jgi:spore germination cell wall hydrolase CwlJ-like protein
MDINIIEVNISCMATAIYAEANTQSNEAKYGVGYVILNRVKSGKFGKDACEVVYKNGQFQGVHDLSQNIHKQPSQVDYLKTKLLAIKIYNHQVVNPVGNSLYFHDDSIKSMSQAWGNKQVKIDNLIFY